MKNKQPLVKEGNIIFTFFMAISIEFQTVLRSNVVKQRQVNHSETQIPVCMMYV